MPLVDGADSSGRRRREAADMSVAEKSRQMIKYLDSILKSFQTKRSSGK